MQPLKELPPDSEPCSLRDSHRVSGREDPGASLDCWAVPSHWNLTSAEFHEQQELGLPGV